MERKIEYLERYLMNEMSVREQVEFEELLRRDPDLRQEFLLRKKINEAIQEKDIIDLRSRLSEISNTKIRINSRKRIIYTYSSVAAAVILLIGIATVFLNPFNKLDQEEVFQSYYKVYPSVSDYRSSNEPSNLNKKLISAFKYYEDANYRMAEEYFNAVVDKDPSNSMSQFYLAVCFIENDKRLEAEIYLKYCFILSSETV